VLYSTDDSYALYDFDSSLPFYYYRKCRDMVARSGDRYYKNIYRNCPAGWLDFDRHQPMIIDVDRFKIIAEEFNYHRIDYPVKSLYANNVDGNRIETACPKIMEEKHLCNIPGKPFFSTKDNAYMSQIDKTLRRLYPEPSQYE
jgi:hypothetical protein